MQYTASGGQVQRGRRPAVAVAAVLVASAVLAAGCGGSSSGGSASGPAVTTPPVNAVGGKISGPPDSAVKDGGKVRYGIDAEPEGLDPTRYAFSQAGHAVASAVFDPLATLDENGKAVPYLAQAFEPSADFKSWTIVLPTGVTFHDGTTLDAAAVKANLEAYKASAITGRTLVDLTSIEAPDPTHVVVGLSRPDRSFVVRFTTQEGYVLAPAMLKNPDLVKKPIGSGPFVFDSHTDGELWAFKKNPNYRQKGLPHLDAIDFVPVVDAAERNSKLLKGDVDVMQTSAGPQISELRANTTVKQVENQHGDKSFLVLNTTKAPFDKLEARQAVAYATDAARWRKDVTADVAAPANSPYGPGQPGYQKQNGYPTFDLAKAKQLVEKYTADTGQPLEFSFVAANDALNATAAQTLATTYQQAGMKVTVQQLPQINLLAQVATGSYQLSQFRVFAAPNPDADVSFYLSTSVPPEGGVSINFPRIQDPRVDQAVYDARATDDAAKRDADYQSIADIFAEQVPFAWLGQNVWMVAANPQVNGVYAAANGSIPIVGPKTWIPALSVNSG